jgi:hypothetical protein
VLGQGIKGGWVRVTDEGAGCHACAPLAGRPEPDALLHPGSKVRKGVCKVKRKVIQT